MTTPPPLPNDDHGSYYRMLLAAALLEGDGLPRQARIELIARVCGPLYGLVEEDELIDRVGCDLSLVDYALNWIGVPS
jgi:hypothetical protein